MYKLTIVAAILLSVCAGGLCAQDDQQEVFEGISRPSGDRALAFTRPGKVAEVLVKDGDFVKVDQPLIQLDDRAERQELAKLEAEAKNMVRVRAAQSKLDLSEVRFKRTEEVFQAGAVTYLEMMEAKLELEMQKLSLELAKFEQVQSEREWKKAQIIVARMSLTSPIEGRVEKLVVEAGEAAEALTPVARVVKVDPLWINVQVRLDAAKKLSQGDLVRVTFGKKSDSERESQDGKILFVRSVADYASETLEVRVEAPNPSQRPANEKVYVTFPTRPKVEAAKKTPANQPVAEKTDTK